MRAAMAAMAALMGMLAAAMAQAGPQRGAAHDIVGFCKARGTLDDPDRAFFGRAYRPGRLPAQVARVEWASRWRCMDGKPFLCQNSADGDACGIKNPSRMPNRTLREECAALPGTDAISFASAHFSSSDWRCAGRTPVITRSYPLDRRGFFKASWVEYRLRPNGTPAPITMPETPR